MNKQEAQRVRLILEPFLKMYRIPQEDGTIAMWMDALNDLTYEQIELAIRRYNKDSTDFPRPAALRKYAVTGNVLSDDERARLAWSVVFGAISRVGGYESVNFSDKLINASLRLLGGWVRLCELPTEELKWKEKDFVQTYKAIAKSGLGDPGYLPGITETTNSRDGYDPPKIKLIESGMPEHVTARIMETRPIQNRIAQQEVKKLAEKMSVNDD